MPESINIGRNVENLETAPRFNAVTGIIMVDDEENEISSGDDSGYVFTIKSPYATQAQAQWLKNKLAGIKYQPYLAKRAILDPAVEIGDYITTRGVFGGIFSEHTTFGTMITADVSAPQDNTIDHEYPYKPQSDRKFSRKMKQIAAEFEIQAEEISAKVSQIGGNNQSFGWNMTVAGMFWYANGSEIMRATRAGLKVTGEINATSGVIGGAKIENGTLTVNNANISSINGSKLTDYSIGNTKYGIGSVYGGTGGAIAAGTVAYGNTSFTGTLDQVGINKSNIEVINGYFTGGATMYSVAITAPLGLSIAGKTCQCVTLSIGGQSYNLVGWGSI